MSDLLTANQRRALAWIAAQTRPVIAADVGAALGTARSSAAGIVSVLVQAGLVAWQGDGRKQEVVGYRATAAGAREASGSPAARPLGMTRNGRAAHMADGGTGRSLCGFELVRAVGDDAAAAPVCGRCALQAARAKR